MKIKLKTGKEYQRRPETARKAEVIMNKLKRASSLKPTMRYQIELRIYYSRATENKSNSQISWAPV